MVSLASIAFVQDDSVAAAAVAKLEATLSATAHGHASTAQAIESVVKETAQLAFVAIDSSVSGTDRRVYDLALAHGLHIVLEHVEPAPDAAVRFVGLAKYRDAVKATSTSLKTSLVVTFPAGDSQTRVLNRVTTVLASKDVESLKLETRLASDGGLVVYLDVEGSDADSNVAAAVTGLRELTYSVRSLGTYAVQTAEKAVESVSVVTEPAAHSMEAKYPLNPVVTGSPLGENLIIYGLAKEMEAAGQHVDSLCIGETDFFPSDRVIDAGVRALKEGHVRYSPMRGERSLRGLVADYYSIVKGVTYDPETEVQITAGAQQGLYHVLYSLILPGDKVVLPSPYWASYEAIVTQVRGGIVELPGKPEDDYLIDPKALEAALTANPEVKVLMLCNPSNPVGTVHSPERLEQVAAVLRKPQFSRVVVVSDEIYEQLIYQDEGQPKREHQSFASLPGMYERTVIVNGFSKAYAMTGLRIGYVAAPRHFVDPCLTLQGHFTSTANSVGQLAAAEALREEIELFQQGKSRIAPVLVGLNAKRQYVTKRLEAIPKLTYAYPSAAFYVFSDLSAYFKDKRVVATKAGTDQTEAIPDVTAFCKYVLREYLVAVSPGVDYGYEFGIRISYALSLETLERSFDKLEHALASLSSEPST